ncbi:MAG TPA: TldD/PmbA family protein [candidate division Zixibacteria bacterium]|nr:TldD/PmbA family protein [candidate division Zixibacteria bacterium]
MKDFTQKTINEVNLGSDGFVDIRFQEAESLTLNIRNGLTEEVTSTRIGGAAARALIGGAWGFATTAEISKDSLKNILKSAVTMAKVASEKIKEPRKIDSKFSSKGTFKLDFDVNPKDISIEEKMNLTLDLEKNISKVDERIANSSATYLESVQTETIISSNGTDVTTDSGVFRLSGRAVGREGNLQQNVGDNIASSVGIKTILDWNVTEKGTEIGETAIGLLSAEKPLSGKMNLIMDPSLVGVFVHEAFGHACEADGIITKRSILHDKLNKEVGIKEINIADDPTIPGLRGTFVFDSEGTKTQKRKLVTNGILTEFFHTLETASLMGLKPNGAGRAMDFRFPPLARMGNTYVEAGDKNLDELFEIVGNGMYLEKSYGGYVNPSQGQFMFSAQNGYIIENGEKKALTQNVSMSGLIMEVLANTMGVGKDESPAFNGSCGKGGQWVPVTGGGPSLAVKDLVVGGR